MLLAVDALPRSTNDQWLVIYVIYNSPRDYPGKFVVRKQGVRGPCLVAEAKPAAVADSLEAARAILPAGLALLPRFADDDPVIEETWL